MSVRFIIKEVAGSTPFDNSTNGYTADNVQDAIEEAQATAEEAQIYPIALDYNGTINNGTWIGYAGNIPGDSTPIIIPKDVNFINFTFSNTRDNADYTLLFRKNSLTASPFLSVSKTSTQYFAYDLGSPEPFSQGDIIYIQYQDDGTNASNVAIILNFRAA